MSKIVFIDTETTGLDPEYHEVWEVAIIVRDTEAPPEDEDVSWVWQLEVDLGKADPIALNIGRFHERRWKDACFSDQDAAAPTKNHIHKPYDQMGRDDEWVVQDYEMYQWCRKFVELTRDGHLVGCVASFDEERLRNLLRRYRQCPMWHYQTHDVQDLATGYLLGRAFQDKDHGTVNGDVLKEHMNSLLELPFNGKRLMTALDIKYNSFERHTALGDAQMARAVFDAVTKGR